MPIAPSIKIGIDLGGTKIEAVALSTDGQELAKKRVATPQGDYQATLASIAELVTSFESDLNQRATIGVGMPGSFSPSTGLVRNANSTWLNHKPFDADLQQLMQREIRFANDANCLAVSEAVDGAGNGYPVVFAIILGTGVGGGIAMNSKVYTGPNSVAGEWGHNPLPWLAPEDYPGPNCYCGRRGCIETFLSGPGFSRDYLEHNGISIKPENIIAAMNDSQTQYNQEQAKVAFLRYQTRLAAALAQTANLLDPDIFVLGGGMSKIAALYDGLAERVNEFIFGGEFCTPIVAAKHGDSSGVRGAAWLW